MARVTGVVVKTVSVEFFCYHRDRPGSVALRDELLEEHWSYMDRYQAELIARGPTLADDGDTPTGSVHLVDLPRSCCRPGVRLRRARLPGRRVPGCAAAPLAQHAGAHHVGLPGGRTGGHRYLVLGLGTGPAADLAPPPDRDELVAYGPLLSDNGATWLGTAVLVRARDPGTARAILTPGRYADIEVHSWRFGGRPS